MEKNVRYDPPNVSAPCADGSSVLLLLLFFLQAIDAVLIGRVVFGGLVAITGTVIAGSFLPATPQKEQRGEPATQ
jgi:hypothetical protein